jgi:hypothetical protein
MKKRKYVKRKITNELVIKEVTKIRRKNNNCWMELLGLAFKAKPRQAKKIMAAITKNDLNVTKWMRRLK